MTRPVHVREYTRNKPQPSLAAHQVIAQFCNAHLDDVMQKALEKALEGFSREERERIRETY